MRGCFELKKKSTRVITAKREHAFTFQTSFKALIYLLFQIVLAYGVISLFFHLSHSESKT